MTEETYAGYRVTVTEAADLRFWCPGCGEYHDGVRALAWTWNGDPVRPTINSSVLTRGRGGTCHCLVRDGRIQYLTNSTHELSGQVVDMQVEA